ASLSSWRLEVSAHISAARVGDWPASELIWYDFTVGEADRRGNRRALWELRAIGPPPHTGQRHAGQMADALRRHGAWAVAVENVADHSRRTRVPDLRSAKHFAGHAVFHLSDVGRSLGTQSYRGRTLPAVAGVLVARAPRPSHRPEKESCVPRDTHRAVE